MKDDIEVLRASYNVTMALISDLQRYSTVTFSPKFARELNEVTTSLAAYINDLEAEDNKENNVDSTG